jgi:hypothetical protein
MNKYLLRILAICIANYMLTACSYSTKDRYEVVKTWDDDGQISIAFLKIKERHTSSIPFNIHGSVETISNENGVYKAKIATDKVEYVIDLRDAKNLSNSRMLYISKILEISEKDNVYFINGVKTNLSPACSSFSDDNDSLVVFGAKFIHCNKIFNWKDKVEEQLPMVFVDRVNKILARRAIAFSISPYKLGIAEVNGNNSVTIYEYNENYHLIKSHTENILCDKCELLISTGGRSFYGDSGFILISDMFGKNDIQTSDGNTRILHCTALSCKAKVNEKNMKSGFNAISGNPPQYLILNQPDYYSPILKFSRQLF